MPRKVAAISIAAAVLGAALIKLHIDQLTRELWGGGRVSLLALTADLETGQALQAAHLTATDIPERFRESRHIPLARREDLLGLRLSGPVKAGELLLITDIAGIRPGDRTLSKLIDEGMRAMSVRVANGGFSRLVRPGDRVDILISRQALAGAETRTLLENLLVLAVGDDLGELGDDRNQRGGRVTLHVTPEQGRRLATAESTGTLRIVLRSPTDSLLGEASHAL